MHANFKTLEWGRTDLASYPNMVVPSPGPKSKAMHERCTKHFKGLSGQVKLFPVALVKTLVPVLRKRRRTDCDTPLSVMNKSKSLISPRR